VSTTAIPGHFTTLPDEPTRDQTGIEAAIKDRAGRLLNRRASPICPQVPGGVP
jgi:hypothetical protein